MKARTPFEDLASALAAHRNPLAQAAEAIDPVHLRALRQQQDELFGMAKPMSAIEQTLRPSATALAIEQALKPSMSTVEAALGLRHGIAEGVLSYKPVNAVLEAALGFKPGDALTTAALGRDGVQDQIDRATAAILGDADLYRSPARDFLDQLGAHIDIKPSGRDKRASKASPAALPASTTRDKILITSVEDIGRRVREVRRGMHMTQQRFADLAGVGRRFLIELERGKASLEIGRVLAVCKAAGIKLGFVA